MKKRCYNTKCYLCSRLGLMPFRRCPYCDIRAIHCFGLQFFAIVLFIITLLVVMFTIRDLPTLALDISLLILLLLSLLGYIASKETDEVILSNRFLKDLNAELEDRVNQRTKELRLLNVELQKASRIKSDFLSNMSHELKTPLTAILGYSSILKDKHLGELNDIQSKQLASIERNGRDLLSLINGLLDLSRVEGSRLEADKKWFDVNKLIGEVTAAAESLATKKDIKLNVATDTKVSSMFGDREVIQQVLGHLLSNAIKFTDNGGYVYIETKDEKEDIRITVRDTGIGIRKEDLAVIFEPFRQLDDSMSRKYGGAGIGLSIVKSLVEAYGGTVAAESEQGKGSAFSFLVPKPKE